MSKVIWKPGTMLYPIPAVMVSCGSSPEEYNIITISWTGTICSEPPMCSISIRPQRHSYEIIKKNMEFVINLTTRELIYAADWCGVKSGRDTDKFKAMHLTPIRAAKVNTPLIKEAPVNIECIVKKILPLGSHDIFMAEVAAIQADRKYIDSVSGAMDLERAGMICYSHGKYYCLGKFIGKFGYSVQKKKKRNKK